jgi:hypothetical protein
MYIGTGSRYTPSSLVVLCPNRGPDADRRIGGI